MRWWLPFLLTLLSYSAWADDSLPTIGATADNVMFTPTTSDLSMEFLRNAFGSVGGALSGADSQLLGQLFGVLNFAILMFAGAWISYIVVTNTINAAQSAGPQGKKINVWMHARAIAGLVMVTPQYGGYSWIQVMTMSVIVQGVGFADTLWTNVLDQLQVNGGQIYSISNQTYSEDPVGTMKSWLTSNTATATSFTNSSASVTTAHIDDVFASALCTAALAKQGDITAANFTSSGSSEDTTTNKPTWGYFTGTDCGSSSTSASVCFGSSDNPTVCGRYSLTVNATANTTTVELMQNFLSNLVSPLWLRAQGLVEEAYDVANDDTGDEDTTYDYTCDSGCDASSTLSATAALAESMLTALPSSPDGSLSNDDDYTSDNWITENWLNSAKNVGWMNAGSYYLNILGLGMMPSDASVTYTLNTDTPRSALTESTTPSIDTDVGSTLFGVYGDLMGAIQGYTVAALADLDANSSLLTNADSSFAASSTDYILDSSNGSATTSSSTLGTSTYQAMNPFLSIIVKQMLAVIWTPPTGSASETTNPFSTSTELGQYSLTVVQDNLFAMMAKVISVMMGLNAVNDANLYNTGGSSSWNWDGVLDSVSCSSETVKTYCSMETDSIVPIQNSTAMCVGDSTNHDCSIKKTCEGKPQYFGSAAGVTPVVAAYPGGTYESNVLCGCEARGNLFSCWNLKDAVSTIADNCRYSHATDNVDTPSTTQTMTVAYAEQCTNNLNASSYSSTTNFLSNQCLVKNSDGIAIIAPSMLEGIYRDYAVGYSHSESVNITPNADTATNETYTHDGCSYYRPPRAMNGHWSDAQCTPYTASLEPCDGEVYTCYDAAVTEGCIVDGYGLIGSFYGLSQGNAVDPITYLATMGMTIVDTSLAFLDSTLQGIINTGVATTIAYTGAMTAWSLAFTAIGFAGKSLTQEQDPSGIGKGAMSEMTRVGGAAGNIISILFSFDITALMLFVPFATAMASTLFMLGSLLGFYVPFLPFIVFVLAVIGWLLLVVETMIAAPLVALSLTHPAGHDLLGRSEQAVILLFGVFIRPAAIIVGFTMALTLSYIAMHLVNYGFLMVLVNFLTYTLSGDADDVIQLIGTVGVLFVYVFTMIDIINHVFSLTYLVPQKLLRWIGGSPESGGIIQSILGSIQSNFRQSMSSLGSGMGRAVANTPILQPRNLAPSLNDLPTRARSAKRHEKSPEELKKEKEERIAKQKAEKEKKKDGKDDKDITSGIDTEGKDKPDPAATDRPEDHAGAKDTILSGVDVAEARAGAAVAKEEPEETRFAMEEESDASSAAAATAAESETPSVNNGLATTAMSEDIESPWQDGSSGASNAPDDPKGSSTSAPSSGTLDTTAMDQDIDSQHPDNKPKPKTKVTSMAQWIRPTDSLTTFMDMFGGTQTYTQREQAEGESDEDWGLTIAMNMFNNADAEVEQQASAPSTGDTPSKPVSGSSYTLRGAQTPEAGPTNANANAPGTFDSAISKVIKQSGSSAGNAGPEQNGAYQQQSGASAMGVLDGLSDDVLTQEQHQAQAAANHAAADAAKNASQNKPKPKPKSDKKGDS